MYLKNINIHMYMYFIKKYKNDMGFDVQINKAACFFTLLRYKTTERDSFVWITLEQY